MIETPAQPSRALELTEENYRDTYPLDDFRADPAHFLQQLNSGYSHFTLTIDGRSAAIVLTPAEYQRLLDLASDADPMEGVRQGSEDYLAGRAQPVDEAFEEIQASYGIPG